ncbi:MAG: heme exporter protein CcmD [Moraxella sp.]|nr:heme exporter protein CcmD [Moraxella sp.]
MNPYYDSLGAFIQMNGYGVYVWSCYAMVFGCIFALIIYAKNERKSAISKLNRQTHHTKLTNKQRKLLRHHE